MSAERESRESHPSLVARDSCSALASCHLGENNACSAGYSRSCSVDTRNLVEGIALTEQFERTVHTKGEA